MCHRIKGTVAAVRGNYSAALSIELQYRYTKLEFSIISQEATYFKLSQMQVISCVSTTVTV